MVKTYPHPSIKYLETVCTAGLTRGGKFIRLYPVDFRYQDSQYKKYQWIRVDVEKNGGDSRVDSYRPTLSTLRILGEPLDTKKGWEKRKGLVLPSISHTSIEHFLQKQKTDGISLGILKPKKMLAFKIESDESEWPEKYNRVFSQPSLFGAQPKPLEKIPYKFSYVFSCNEEGCKKHEIQILDWEIYELYRGLKRYYNYSADVILEKIKEKWFDQMWDDSRDSYLFVGSHSRFKTPLILGVFWPPK